MSTTGVDRNDGERSWTEREVPRSTARNVLDLIRTHDNDGYIFPCEVAFDGTRVEAIGYGRPPLDPLTGEVDAEQDRETLVLAIVIDDDLAEHITVLEHDYGDAGEDEDQDEDQ